MIEMIEMIIEGMMTFMKEKMIIEDLIEEMIFLILMKEIIIENII